MEGEEQQELVVLGPDESETFYREAIDFFYLGNDGPPASALKYPLNWSATEKLFRASQRSYESRVYLRRMYERLLSATPENVVVADLPYMFRREVFWKICQLEFASGQDLWSAVYVVPPCVGTVERFREFITWVLHEVTVQKRDVGLIYQAVKLVSRIFLFILKAYAGDSHLFNLEVISVMNLMSQHIPDSCDSCEIFDRLIAAFEKKAKLIYGKSFRFIICGRFFTMWMRNVECPFSLFLRVREEERQEDKSFALARCTCSDPDLRRHHTKYKCSLVLQDAPLAKEDISIIVQHERHNMFVLVIKYLKGLHVRNNNLRKNRLNTNEDMFRQYLKEAITEHYDGENYPDRYWSGEGSASLFCFLVDIVYHASLPHESPTRDEFLRTVISEERYWSDLCIASAVAEDFRIRDKYRNCFLLFVLDAIELAFAEDKTLFRGPDPFPNPKSLGKYIPRKSLIFYLCEHWIEPQTRPRTLQVLLKNGDGRRRHELLEWIAEAALHFSISLPDCITNLSPLVFFRTAFVESPFLSGNGPETSDVASFRRMIPSLETFLNYHFPGGHAQTLKDYAATRPAWDEALRSERIHKRGRDDDRASAHPAKKQRT